MRWDDGGRDRQPLKPTNKTYLQRLPLSASGQLQLRRLDIFTSYTLPVDPRTLLKVMDGPPLRGQVVTGDE